MGEGYCDLPWKLELDRAIGNPVPLITASPSETNLASHLLLLFRGPCGLCLMSFHFSRVLRALRLRDVQYGRPFERRSLSYYFRPVPTFLGVFSSHTQLCLCTFL